MWSNVSNTTAQPKPEHSAKCSPLLKLDWLNIRGVFPAAALLATSSRKAGSSKKLYNNT